MIEWKMPDKSVFKIDDMWEKALNMKVKSEGITLEQAREVFIPMVEEHWKAKTIPTKFSFDETWKQAHKTYRNMGELAYDVMYPIIRGALMGLALGELYEKDKKSKTKPKEVKVIGLNSEGGATVYGGDGKVKKHKDWEDAIPEMKKKGKKS